LTIELEIKVALQELVNFVSEECAADQVRKASQTVLKHFGLTDPAKIKAQRLAQNAAEIARIVGDRGPLTLEEGDYLTADGREINIKQDDDEDYPFIGAFDPDGDDSEPDVCTWTMNGLPSNDDPAYVLVERID
jgi:hypothetical protein